MESVRCGDLDLPTPVSISFRLIEEWFDASGKGRLGELAAMATGDAGKRRAD